MENSSGAIPSSNAKLKSGLSLFRCFRKSVRFTTALPLMKEDTPAKRREEAGGRPKISSVKPTLSVPAEVLGCLLAQQTGYQSTSHSNPLKRKKLKCPGRQTNRYMV